MSRPPGPPTSPSPAGPANPGSWQWAAWASTGPAMGPRGLQPLSRSRREPNCPFLGHWWEVTHQPTKCRRRLTRLQRGWAKKEKDQCRPATTSRRSTGLCGDEPPPTSALPPLTRARVMAEGGHAPSPDAPATCSGNHAPSPDSPATCSGNG